MDELEKQEKLNNDLKNLMQDMEMLFKTIEVKREELADGVTETIEKLTDLTAALEKENVSLHSLPRKIETKLHEIVPDITEQLHVLNQNILENQNKTFNDTAVCFKQLQETYQKKQGASLDEATLRLNQLKEKIEEVDTKRIKRYFVGFGIVTLISVFASLGATYAMIKTFPQRVQIESPNNVIVQESEVGLWSSKNVNVSGDVKKRGRK
jgi:hypothetical protein